VSLKKEFRLYFFCYIVPAKRRALTCPSFRSFIALTFEFYERFFS